MAVATLKLIQVPGVFQGFTQHVFMIAANHPKTPATEQFQNSSRLKVITDDVASHEQCVDRSAARRAQYRLKRQIIAVNVPEETEFHFVLLTFRATIITSLPYPPDAKVL